MKNILIFSDEIPPAGGGSGIIAKKLTDNYIKEHYQVTLLSGDEADYNSSNLRHIRVKRVTFLWVLAYGIKIFFNLNLNDFDHIIINDQMSAYLAGLFFTKEQLSKCTIIIHGRDSNFFFKLKSLKHTIFFFAKFYSRAIRYCRKIVAVSHWTQEEYLKYIPEAEKNIIKNKMSWHFAGIDHSDLCGGELPSNVKELNLDNKQILISVGRLVERKGYFKMLDILVENCKSNQDLVWLIVGDGPDRKALEIKSSELGVESKVMFIGKVPRNSLKKLYSLADVFWLYSKIEPYGLVFLEAASCNLPSLGPDEGGVKEAIVENETGFYMDDNLNIQQAIEKCKGLSSTNKPLEYADSISTFKFSSYIIGKI